MSRSVIDEQSTFNRSKYSFISELDRGCPNSSIAKAVFAKIGALI